MVRPAWAHSCGYKSHRELITANEAKRKQLHEGDRVWGGSVERSCGPMNKNRIEGVDDCGLRYHLLARPGRQRPGC